MEPDGAERKLAAIMFEGAPIHAIDRLETSVPDPCSAA